MDPASVIEAVPTEYGFEGYIAISMMLAVLIGGGWIIRYMFKQWEKDREKAQENFEKALNEHSQDRAVFKSAINETNLAFTAAIQSMNTQSQHQSERLSDKLDTLSDDLKDMARSVTHVS